MRADRGAGEKSSRRTVWFVITGAHVIVYSSDAEADRAFFQDVLQYPSVDAGGGWLIFKLPPAEVAVHPAEGAGAHELYLMCDDVNATVDDLKAKGVTCGPISDEGWGLLTSIRLPGGGDLGLYQPRHPKATEL
jgi:catechol 2,3-dioxygenase-like lactoylglutathione lyase family enzyme